MCAAGAHLEAGLHAAAPALLAVLPLHLSCEPGDVRLRHATRHRPTAPPPHRPTTAPPHRRTALQVGCECNALRKGSSRGGRQRLLLFDKCEGGIGIAARLHGQMAPLLRTALEMTTACPCRDGCWCCVHAASCTEYNAATDKRAAVAILELLLRLHPAEEPPGPEASAVRSVQRPECRPCAGPSACARSPDDTMLGRSIRRLRSIAPPAGK